MGCNCKNKNIDGFSSIDSSSKENLLPKIGSYILKSLAFILMLIALPIINLVIIWFMFKTLVLNKEVNIKPILLSLGKKFQEKDEDDDDIDDYESLTEDDVIMEDVEIISN